MFKRKKLIGDEPRFFLIQKLAQHIDITDILTEEMSKPLSRKHSLMPTTEEFYGQLEALKELDLLTHEQTKNKTTHAGIKVGYCFIPLVFLAVMYDRRNIFEALIKSLGADIADLKDGMVQYKGNILHHMYGHNSKASDEMINDVFVCLEGSTSKEKIVAMIEAKDASGYTVLDHATSFGLGKNLKSRLSNYKGISPDRSSYHPIVSPLGELAGTATIYRSLSFFPLPMHSSDEAEVATALLDLRDFVSRH